MIDHIIQQAIIRRLTQTDSARFSELKPDDIENKLFDYHLKKVIGLGLVHKDDEGLYALTSEGRILSTRLLAKLDERSKQAEAVLFLLIRRTSDGAWLYYRRKTQPLFGKSGFMHAIPNSKTSILNTAQEAATKVGITADFAHRGSGYFRIHKDDELESFTHFDLLVCDDATGEPNNSDVADYFWTSDPLAEDELLPNMQTLIDLYNSNESFFHEATITY